MFSVEVKKIDPVKRDIVVKEVYEVIHYLDFLTNNKLCNRLIHNSKKQWKKKNEEVV